MNIGPMHFYTGIPGSKVATYPRVKKKDKDLPGSTAKSKSRITLFIWGEVGSDKESSSTQNTNHN